MTRLKEFEDNLQKNQSRLLGLIASKIKNKSDAFDILQKASLTMWKKYDSFDKDTEFMSWASTISSFEVKNYIRSYNRCPVSFDSEVYDTVSLLLKTSTVDENKQELYDKLHKALSRLDEVSKRIITAVYVDNVEIKDLAKKDGKSPQTYYNKSNLAKKKLLSYLNE